MSKWEVSCKFNNASRRDKPVVTYWNSFEKAQKHRAKLKKAAEILGITVEVDITEVRS